MGNLFSKRVPELLLSCVFGGTPSECVEVSRLVVSELLCSVAVFVQKHRGYVRFCLGSKNTSFVSQVNFVNKIACLRGVQVDVLELAKTAPKKRPLMSCVFRLL